MPIIKRRSVDLLQPLGPIRTVVQAGGMARSIGCRAGTPLYLLESPLISNMAGSVYPLFETAPILNNELDHTSWPPVRFISPNLYDRS